MIIAWFFHKKCFILTVGNRSGLGGYATPKNFEEKINRFHEESPIIQNLNILKKQLNAEEQFNDLNCLVKLKFYYDSVEKIIGSLVTYYPEVTEKINLIKTVKLF